MRSLVAPFVFAFASLVAMACGPSAAQIAAVESTRMAEEFPIAPMQLVITRGKSGALVLALDKDGMLRDEKAVVGTLKAGRVVGTKGEERLSVDGEGRVRYAGSRTLLRFERDEIVSDNGKRISVDESGNVIFTPPMKRRRLPYSFRFEGFTPTARRTALLLLVLVVLDAEKDTTDDD